MNKKLKAALAALDILKIKESDARTERINFQRKVFGVADGDPLSVESIVTVLDKMNQIERTSK